jgi:hypothetical protein
MIERIFETKMPPKTLESRASRHKAKLTSNEVNGPSAGNDEEKACNDCNKTEKKDVVAAVHREAEKLGSISKAAETVARKIGRPKESVRVTYQREKAKAAQKSTADFDSTLIYEEFLDSFDRFRDSILNIKALKWKAASREAVLEKLEELYQLAR